MKDVMSVEHDEADLNTTINTTPLVDVMLVLLIVFLITVPVAIHTVPVNLPTVTNIPTTTKPQNIIISVAKDDTVYVNQQKMDNTMLLNYLKAHAGIKPQPEVHIRGDADVDFGAVGRVVLDCQRAGIVKVGFITEPEHISGGNY